MRSTEAEVGKDNDVMMMTKVIIMMSKWMKLSKKMTYYTSFVLIN